MLKKALKSLGYRLCYGGKYDKRLLDHIKRNNLISILSFHQVSPSGNTFWPPLRPKVFDELLKYLKKHFEIVTLHELNLTTSKKPKLVLSFDDGYYDFIEYAMPILRKYGIRANQNVIPSQLLGEKPLWNIRLYDFLSAAPATLIREIHFPGFNASKIIKGSLSKLKFGLCISKALKFLSAEERSAIMKDLEENLFTKLDYYPITRMLRLNEMSEVLAEHEVGVHSYSHDTMEKESMLRFSEDFKKCKDFFQKNNFPEMDIYAFPNGSYREEQITYLKENGVQYVLLSGDQYARPYQSPYHRFNIAGFSQFEAIFQALGIKHYLRNK